MSAEPSSLYRALVEAQAKFPAVPKDGLNPHFRSKFVTLDALIAATRPGLNAAGLAITQFPTVDAGEPVLKTTIAHAASGEQLLFVTPLYLDSETSQSFGKAVTYARRYAWAAALGIASEEDTDGEPAREAKPTEKKGPKPASPPQLKKLFAQVKELNEAQMVIPAGFPGAEDWLEVLRQQMQANYGTESTKELSSAQASELIDWLEEQAIPFG